MVALLPWVAGTRFVWRDGFKQAQAQCPRCGTWADVDDEQLLGRVSLICTVCEWHGWVPR